MRAFRFRGPVQVARRRHLGIFAITRLVIDRGWVSERRGARSVVPRRREHVHLLEAPSCARRTLGCAVAEGNRGRPPEDSVGWGCWGPPGREALLFLGARNDRVRWGSLSVDSGGETRFGGVIGFRGLSGLIGVMCKFASQKFVCLCRVFSTNSSEFCP